jgi:hypothetical protein
MSAVEKNNSQSGTVVAVPHYSAQGLFAPSCFLASGLDGILAVIFVVIGRISPHAETG